MKRIFTFLLLVLFSSVTFAADLNPFAYDLYTTTTSNGETDLHFSTNAKSKKIDIYLNVGGTWKRLPREYVEREANSYHTVVSESDISALGLVYGQSYTWKVVVTPYDRSNVEYVDQKRVDMPAFSVDVDNNPQSKHFGRILVSNGTNQLGNNTHGIYEYTPTLELIQNYNGGLSNSTSDWYNNQHLSPYRIRIAQDGSGRIFATNYDVDKSVYLWQINPDNLSSWTQIISRTAATSMVGKDQYEKQNTLPVYNIGLDLKTNGNTYQFLLLSASREKETVFTYGNAYCGIYTIPNINTPGTGSYERIDIPKVSSNCEIRNIISNAISSNAQFDKNGNVWYCGNSAYSGNTTKAGLVHQVVSSGDRKENYNSVLDFHRYTVASGGIRHHYNSADNRVVIAQGGTKTSESGRADVIASIYTVDNSVHPVLTRVADLKVPEKNDNLWYVVDFAWDYANNIYACVRNASATYRGVHVFATDLNETPIETPCKNSFVLSKGHDLNPYAYDLSAEWHNDTKILSVNFTLNAAPNMDENAGPKGIQIYAVDKNENRYLIYQVPTATITSAANGMKGPYHIDIPFEVLKGDDAVYRDQHGTPIPKDLLTWEVTVCGRSNDNKYSGKTTTPEVVKYTIDNRPNRVHGVAINNYENSPEFGQMYVTEGIQSQPADDTKGRWTWLSGKFPSLLSYTPQLAYEAFYKNGFSDPDPHRVRVSDDGRVFVSSHLWGGATAVWEFKNGTYTPIIKTIPADWRVMSIDVKGSGSGLKMLVCYFDKTKIGSNMTKGLVCREYNIGSVSSVNANTGTEKAICPDYKTGNSSYGLMYQAVYDINTSGHPLKAAASQWDFSKAGLASAVYDSNNMIWMKVDFFANNQINSHIVAFNSSSTSPLERTLIPLETELYYGGGGILVKGDTLITGNNCAIDFYRINTSTGAVSRIDRLSTNADGELFTNIWVNDISIDHAQNVYVASAWAGNIMVLALPYNGHTTTRAPQKAENQFMLGTPITWHPYHCPKEEIKNEDLWLMFMDAYNDWYKNSSTQPIVTTRADQPIDKAFIFMFSGEKENDGVTHKYPDGLAKDFMTNPNSPWKWLGDYILSITTPTNIPATNEALWDEFKPYYNEYYSLSRSLGFGVDQVSSFAAALMKDIMTNNNSKYKWLGDYIALVSQSQGITIGTGDYNTENTWRFMAHAFFGKSPSGTYWDGIANKTLTHPDFSEAGKPENWKPYYVSQEGKKQIDTDLEWREEIHAFFNKTNECSYTNINDQYVTVQTSDYSIKGQSDQANDGVNGWYDEWWNATFKTHLVTGEALPQLRSEGYLLEGWFYGGENGYKYLVSGDRSGDFLFNETAADGRVHLWARWIDACLEESYFYEADQHALDLQGVGKINLNEEVVMTAARQCNMGKAAKLDVNRKLQGGMYNTIVLPFAIPKKSYFDKVTDLEGNYIFNEAQGGSAPSILVYEGCERITVNGEEVLQLIYHELGDKPNMEDSEGRYESIPAYTPFLIKPTGGNVTTRLHFWPAYVGSGVPVPNYTGDITPMGHFIPGTVTIPDGSIMLILVADNRLAKVTSSGEMMGLRGYFLMPESMKSMPAQICIKENAPTDTEEVEADSVDGVYKILDNQRVYIIRGEEVYTIMGDRVR
ncbi:MAG: hypothetical protein J6R26_06290 [Paludibacteraceae bacterium]|nr:hypothetical protein [Paludibacteraceae bacterium]